MAWPALPEAASLHPEAPGLPGTLMDAWLDKGVLPPLEPFAGVPLPLKARLDLGGAGAGGAAWEQQYSLQRGGLEHPPFAIPAFRGAPTDALGDISFPGGRAALPMQGRSGQLTGDAQACLCLFGLHEWK